MKSVNESMFAVFCGFFSGCGVFVWGTIVALLLTKWLTGSMIDVFLHRFKPTIFGWMMLSCLLILGSFSGGYVAARIGNHARVVHAIIVGVLMAIALLFIRENPLICLLPPVGALAASTFVLPIDR